jgi:anti-sigma factor RsiW
MSRDRNCEWVLERHDAYVDGVETELSDDERLAVASHVESCAACARELALTERVRAGLRGLAIPAAPSSVIERGERAIADTPTNVVALRPRARARRWMPVAAAALLLISAVWVERDRRRANELAVERAARDTGVAFAYFNKYARRAGDIVEDEVIEQRLVAPVEKAMKKSGVRETKAGPGQS